MDAPDNATPSGCLPPGFYPLRLVLRVGRHSVELTRPEVVVGRHSRADVRLPSPDVSRRHCRLAFVDGCWQAHDLHSLNGTFVNEERIEQVVLQDQDILRVGAFAFEVQLPLDQPTVQLPTRSAPGADVLARIAEALPPEESPPLRKAS